MDDKRQVAARIDADQYAELEAIAEQEERSVSAMVRRAIRRELKENETKFQMLKNGTLRRKQPKRKAAAAV